nr:hypothetical protein BaRGS_022930 [Batillaria attramentaria]
MKAAITIKGLDMFSPKSISSVTGMSRAHPKGWQLYGNFTGFQVSSSKSTDFLNKFYGDFSFTVTCHLLDNSRGSLLTVQHEDHRLPHLDLQVDLLGKVLRVHVDCEEGKKVELRKGVGEIPPDAVVSFGTKTGRQRGLQGIVFGAVLSVHAEPDVEGCMKDDSKELAADQPVIPGIGFALEASIDDRVAYLEQQVSQLVMMVNMLKTQGPNRGDIPVTPDVDFEVEVEETVGDVDLDLFGYDVNGFDRAGDWAASPHCGCPQSAKLGERREPVSTPQADQEHSTRSRCYWCEQAGHFERACPAKQNYRRRKRPRRRQGDKRMVDVQLPSSFCQPYPRQRFCFDTDMFLTACTWRCEQQDIRWHYNYRTGNCSRRFDKFGLDWQGFDMDGFNEEGYNRYGYNRQGYDLEGFNLTGYNVIGEYDGIIEYDQRGFDPEGFNR